MLSSFQYRQALVSSRAGLYNLNVMGDASDSVCRDGVLVAKKKRGGKLGTVKLFVRLQEVPETGHTAVIFWRDGLMADKERLDPNYGKPKGKYYWAIHDVRLKLLLKPTIAVPPPSHQSGCSRSSTLPGFHASFALCDYCAL